MKFLYGIENSNGFIGFLYFALQKNLPAPLFESFKKSFLNKIVDRLKEGCGEIFPKSWYANFETRLVFVFLRNAKNHGNSFVKTTFSKCCPV